MAQGPILTDDVKGIIGEVYLEHSDWVAKQVMVETHRRIHRLYPKAPKGWPGISAVQIELRKVKLRHAEVMERGQDVPWNVLDTEEPPIPAEAMPYVLRVWLYTSAEEKLPFTVREAKWVVRLYALFKDKDIKELAHCSMRFAYKEIDEEMFQPYSGSDLLDKPIFDLCEMAGITTPGECAREYVADQLRSKITMLRGGQPPPKPPKQSGPRNWALWHMYLNWEPWTRMTPKAGAYERWEVKEK